MHLLLIIKEGEYGLFTCLNKNVAVQIEKQILGPLVIRNIPVANAKYPYEQHSARKVAYASYQYLFDYFHDNMNCNNR